MLIYTSNLPCDQDMIHELGSLAVPINSVWGDACFFGVNDKNEPIRIGCERKKIRDMVACILSGRYLYQAQMAKENGVDVLVLIVEGKLHFNRDGLLDEPTWGVDSRNITKKRMMWRPVTPAITYSRWCQYLFELSYLAGIFVIRTADVKETCAVICSLCANFQKPPSEHGSLHQIFVAPPTQVQLFRPGLVRRIAKELPSIGWERSLAVEAKFRTPWELANAGIGDWQSVEGIGEGIARKVVQAIGKPQ